MNNLFKYRLILIIGQLCLLAANQLWPFWLGVDPEVWLICALYLVAIVVLQITYSQAHQSRFMVALDLFLWAGYFYFLDGVSNPLIWCLLIPSVLSALSQSVPFTWLVTLLANGLYLSLWALTAQSTGQHSMHDTMMQKHITGMWLGFIAVSVLLTWVTTTLMQRINNKNKALLTFEKQRQADESIIKMATLATSLAHELGTPLASIKLLINELKLNVNMKQHGKDFEILDSQVMRCKKVLEELTAVTDKSRLDDSQVMVVTAFVESLVDSVDSGTCEVRLSFGEKLSAHIEVDALLHLACVNVLNNSISAGAKQINIEVIEQDQLVLISIEDDGKGQSHKNTEGLGIGLKLSSRILESIGGSLSISMSTSGALTSVSIPVSVERGAGLFNKEGQVK